MYKINLFIYKFLDLIQDDLFDNKKQKINNDYVLEHYKGDICQYQNNNFEILCFKNVILFEIV